MSTVKIKTEPVTATTATVTTVDVQVKLEPSLSTADIKHEQHSSDIDTKLESDSDTDREEDSDDDDDDDDDQFTITSKNQRQFRCEHPGCGRSFKRSSDLKRHQRDHKLQVEFAIYGKTYILTRQSLNDRWPCPIPDCPITYRTVDIACHHIRRDHGNTTGQHQQQHQQPSYQNSQRKFYFIGVNDFYVNDVRCGYHSTIGVFICYECKLVPECFLTHLQQKHGYDEKSIDKSILPESAVNANADPNINQHTSNPHLAAAISQPYQQQHQNTVQGWLCVTSDCGFCCYTAQNKSDHKKFIHKGEQISTVPTLVLRLHYAKTRCPYFFITRLDTTSNSVNPNNSSQYNNANDDDDGDELVLSDYSD